MGETRFSTVYLTLKSVQDIYPELREKLETRGEIAHIENIDPDALSVLVTFLEPFYNAQRELEVTNMQPQTWSASGLRI